MKAATADETQTPFIGRFEDPRAQDGCEVVEMRAAALTNLDVAVALGRHYLSDMERPFVIGREGVAVASDGRRRFYTADSMVAPYGSMAERALVRAGIGLPVPGDVPDDLAAALGNAGLAAWLPLSWRAAIAPGEKVLILGATGVSGLIAVAAAHILGAGHIVAAGRNADALRMALALGADDILDLTDMDELTGRMADATQGGADIVLDYLNGPPAEAALGAMRPGGRMVQIGSPLSPGLFVDAQNARMRSLDIMGFAYYHAPRQKQADAYRLLCEHALAGDIRISMRSHKLADFHHAWQAKLEGCRSRIIVIP